MQPVKRLRTQSWDAGNSDAYQSKVEHVYASRTVLNFLSERERYYPIFERICLFLPIECLCALSCVSKGLAGLQKDLRKTQWNVDKKLRRFVRNPQALRSQLGQADAVISGSFAVQFFDRVTFPGSDLDIYVTIGSNADTLGQYLMDVEEYQLVNQRGQEEYNECTKHIWEVCYSRYLYMSRMSFIAISVILSLAERMRLPKRQKYRSLRTVHTSRQS